MPNANLILGSQVINIVSGQNMTANIIVPPRTLEISLSEMNGIGTFYITNQINNLFQYLTGVDYTPGNINTANSVITSSFGILRFKSTLVLYPGCILRLESTSTFPINKNLFLQYITEAAG